jgi:hypothetical protein
LNEAGDGDQELMANRRGELAEIAGDEADMSPPSTAPTPRRGHQHQVGPQHLDRECVDLHHGDPLVVDARGASTTTEEEAAQTGSG